MLRFQWYDNNVSIAENDFSLLMLRFQWNHFSVKQEFTLEVLY